MKRLFVCFSVSIFAFAAALAAQQPKAAPGRAPMRGQGRMASRGPLPSPAAKASVTINGKAITINYNSPRVRGRQGKIFNKGGLINQTHTSYPIWRGGADAATTLHTAANLTIGNLNVPAGTYTLFVDIANPNQWTLVVSKDTGEWGLAYKANMDLGRTPMQMSKPPALIEDLKYTLTNDGGNKGTLTLAWEYHVASVNFTVH